MGKKAVKKYFNVVMLTFTAILFIFTFIGLYGGDVSPEGHTMRASATLALPVIIILVVLVEIYWLVRRSWFALIPIIPLCCTFKYIGTLYQFGSKPAAVKPNFIVASYNVRAFNRDATGIVSMDVLSTLQKESADVICLQEFNNSASGDERTVIDRYREAYPYNVVGKDVVILSRMPIKDSKLLPFEYGNNGAVWADVQVDASHIVRVFNVHMETTGINTTLHRASKNGDLDGAKSSVDIMMNQNVRKSLIDNYVMNGVVRGGQAVQIANERHNSPYPVVLCGDFNDVPYSYTYNTLLGDLKDGFRQGGYGLASTFHGMKGLPRIDYIFHADNMESLDYYTVESEISDHNPVISKLSFVAKGDVKAKD